MSRRFATMRELTAPTPEDRPQEPGDKRPPPPRRDADELRREFRYGQTAGKVVMVDRADHNDPADAMIMMLVATVAGFLVRVPLTRAEALALIDFARAEGGVSLDG